MMSLVALVLLSGLVGIETADIELVVVVVVVDPSMAPADDPTVAISTVVLDVASEICSGIVPIGTPSEATKVRLRDVPMKVVPP